MSQKPHFQSNSVGPSSKDLAGVVERLNSQLIILDNSILMHFQLGIPTANIPLEGLEIGGNSDLESGVYYGWAGLDVSGSKEGQLVYPMVMSIGWNPFYKNTVRSVVSILLYF